MHTECLGGTNPLDNIPGAINPDYVKDILAQVDPADGRASRFIANHICSSIDQIEAGGRGGPSH
jgi:hypothetical protein